MKATRKKIFSISFTLALFVAMVIGLAQPMNVSAASNPISVKTSTGGDFIKGVNKVTITYKAVESAKQVKIDIRNKKNESIYYKVYKNVKKGEKYSFVWDGKNSKGKYVPLGTYQVAINTSTVSLHSRKVKFCTQDFAGGDGSAKYPYKVKTFSQFKKIIKHNGCHFIQTANIDGKNANYKTPFTRSKSFTGTYDGNSKTIKGLNVTPNENKAGVFGYISNKGTIKNTNFSNITIKLDGSQEIDTGIVAGDNYGTISNCTVYDSTMVEGENIGGIAGWNSENGIIKGCTVSNLSIKASRRGIDLGGVVGETNGMIEKCRVKSVKLTYNYSNNGSILERSGLGGICGYVEYNTAYLKSCRIDKMKATVDKQCYYKLGALTGALQPSIDHIVNCTNNTTYDNIGKTY